MPTLKLQSFSRPMAKDIITLISTKADGSASGFVSAAQVTADGRYVVFQSVDPLVPSDDNDVLDIYVKDVWNNTLTRVSSKADGLPTPDEYSVNPHISPDGRYVVFESLAQLVPSDTDNGVDIYIRDLRDNTLTRISTKADGSQATDGDSYAPQVTFAGKYVVFSSTAQLVATDTDEKEDIYLRDLEDDTLIRVSNPIPGLEEGDSYNPHISSDGRYIMFMSGAQLADADINHNPDIYQWDSLNGTITLIPDSPESGGIYNPNITADGRYVVFESYAPLIEEDTDSYSDIYIKDLHNNTLTRISKPVAGLVQGHSYSPTISADGRYVLFDSNGQLVESDIDSRSDVYMWSLQDGTLTRLSTLADGSQAGEGRSWTPQISPDGRYVVFESEVRLVAEDRNMESDIYRIDTAYVPYRQAIAEERYLEASFEVGAASKVAIRWGDGSVDTGVPVGGTATFDHVYATTGSKNAFVVVNEGAQTWVVPYRINLTSGQMIRNKVLADTLSGGAGNDSLAGDSFSNVIRGGSGDDVLRGGAGNDTLWGGAGSDSFRGGSGRDTFVFDGRSRKPEKIIDFSPVNDTFWLENAYFKVGAGSLARPGKISKQAFHVGEAAHDSSDRIIYDIEAGALYYDPDGIGHAAKIKIASLSKGLKSLTANDFMMV
ncbi:hypothetical protein [Microvirga sp. G4-2]|uniref:hypothetical protein n=1 Tax=Microvirga sp. G4-2 TaxID=3434467 RepID=UPI004044C930